MPLTSKPFRLNTSVSFQEEKIVLKSDKATISTAPRDVLIWSRSGDKSYTYTRRVRGLHRQLMATQDADPTVAIPAFITLTPHANANWTFFGNHHTPCVGESVISAYPTPTANSAEVLALVTLLQHNTEMGEPDQLTLAQAIAAVVPDILAEYPSPSEADLLSGLLTWLSTRFHVVVTLFNWPHSAKKYEVYRHARDPHLLVTLGLFLLPLIQQHLQPA